jgi:hypothetical protein
MSFDGFCCMKKPTNFTYTVSGQDGRNEGPFGFDEMKRRIADGRITGSTFVQRSDSPHWSTAADFPELKVKDVVVSRYDHEAGPDALTQEIEESRFRRAVRSGAGWFFWIAAMSLINSFAAFLGSEAGFALGLSIVYPLGETGANFGATGSLVALVLGLALTLFYFFCGVAGWKKYFTPYLLGLALYAGDTALAFVTFDWISAAIHVIALMFMCQGLVAHLNNRGEDWTVKLVLPYAVAALLVAGGGWGLVVASNPARQDSSPESWAGKPVAEWPQLVLTHDSEFRGHSGLKGASAFLIELPDERIIAATAKHLLGADGGVSPKLHVNEIDGAIVTWNLHPRSKPDGTVAVKGLFGPTGAHGALDDWLLLQIDPAESNLPASPLKLRHAPLQKGEPVYIVGVRYDNGENTQEVFPGKVTNPDYGIIEGTLDKPVNLEGFSGAPVLDANGHVVAVLTGSHSNADKSGRYKTFAGHGVGEIKRLLRAGRSAEHQTLAATR